MQFYLLVAWCTPWLVRAHWLKVILIWSGLAIGWRYLSTIFISSETLDVQNRIFTSYLLIGSLDQFAMGIGVAKLCLDGKLSFTPARGFFWGTSTFILLFASASILNTHPSYWNFDVMVWGWRSLASAGFAALIATVIMIPYSGNWLMRPFCYLGKISYGIYLWHLPVLFSLIAHTPWRGASLLRATLICTIVLAVLSWHGFEKKWMHSKTAKSTV